MGPFEVDNRLLGLVLNVSVNVGAFADGSLQVASFVGAPARLARCSNPQPSRPSTRHGGAVFPEFSQPANPQLGHPQPAVCGAASHGCPRV
jgi:hypothetical protein